MAGNRREEERRKMDGFDIGLALAWYLAFVFSTVLHEAAHAYVAWRLGDPTAYWGGQVSLNPAPHMQREPFGMVVLPIISYIMGGWMIGWASTPMDPLWARQYPKRAALMALAGPAANLGLVVLAGIAIRIGMAAGVFFAPDKIGNFSQITSAGGPGVTHAMAMVVSILFGLNLILFVFKLLPVPPLDGSGVIPMFLSADGANRYEGMIRQPVFAIIGLVVAWNLMERIVGPVYSLAVKLLYPGVY